MPQQFRLQKTLIFLTYPCCSIMPAVCLANIQAKLANRRTPIEVAGYSVGQKHHEDGGLHLHALVKLNKKPNISDSTIFDLVEGEVVNHPNIDTEVRNFNATKEYIRKEHRENMEGAQNAGVLLENWPVQLDKSGKNKRKAQYTDEEVFDMVKRSRTSEEYLQECLIARPSVLQRNFANIQKFSQWVLPKKEHVQYEPDFAVRNWVVPPEIEEWKDKHLKEVAGREGYKTLVLWGPSRMGKTEWAKSHGRHTYWQGTIDPQEHNKDGDYYVVDDVPIKCFKMWKQVLGKKKDWTMREKSQSYMTIKRALPAIYCYNKDPRYETGNGLDWADIEWLNINCQFVEIREPLYVTDFCVTRDIRSFNP